MTDTNSATENSDSSRTLVLLVIFGIFCLIIIISLILAGILPDRTEEETDDPKIETITEENIQNSNIEVDDLVPGDKITTPITITGQAAGWFFEGEFWITVINESGEEIGDGTAFAIEDWMTDEYVPFKAHILFDPEQSKKGKLIFQKANPSGRLEFDEVYEIAVTF